VLTARAENFLRGNPDLDDTIARLLAFEKAGADVLYAPGLRTLDEVATVCRSVARPVNVIMVGKAPFATVAELGAAGVRRVSVGSGFSRAAMGAFLRAAREVKDHGTFTYGQDAAGTAEVEAFFAEGR
jgi:2-methylisocitrate lyase-like PEP mutase family enzyme